jgi:hypothetical protein
MLLISHPLYRYKQKRFKNKYSKTFGDHFQLTVLRYSEICIKQTPIICGIMYVKQGFLLNEYRRFTNKMQVAGDFQDLQ